MQKVKIGSNEVNPEDAEEWLAGTTNERPGMEICVSERINDFWVKVLRERYPDGFYFVGFNRYNTGQEPDVYLTPEQTKFKS